MSRRSEDWPSDPNRCVAKAEMSPWGQTRCPQPATIDHRCYFHAKVFGHLIASSGKSSVRKPKLDLLLGGKTDEIPAQSVAQ